MTQEICVDCGVIIPIGTWFAEDEDTDEVRCLPCSDVPEDEWPDDGEAVPPEVYADE